MKFLFISLIFLVLVHQQLHSQWYKQESGITRYLHGISFVDEHNGWVVGDSGTIIHTTNSGKKWNPEKSGTIKSLYKVSFTDLYHGIAVGDLGEILRTSDGGLNWIQTNVNDCILFNVFFVDSNTGWIVGFDYANSEAKILYTNNGGIDWIPQSAEVDGPLFGVCFVDTSTGWVVGFGEDQGGTILKTTNGGKKWIEQKKGYWPLTDICFIDENNGWAGGGCDIIGTVLRTTDGGTTWNEQLPAGECLAGVYFVDFNTGFVVSNSYQHPEHIFRTTDSGKSWINQENGFQEPLCDVFFTDSYNGWAAGAWGTILHTTNGGISAIEENDNLSSDYVLEQNYPNPFNPTTKIKYSVSKPSQVQITIFDVLGNEIETLVDEEKPAGIFEITWNAFNMTSGVYFYRIKAGDFIHTKKMVLLK